MSLLTKIQKERVARDYIPQVANQMLYIFDDYQDHNIYENIHAAVDYMISYNEAFYVKAPNSAYVYHIHLSSVFDHEDMIKLDRTRKVSKLTIVLQDNDHMCNLNLFECYLEINNSNFDESTLDIKIVHAAKDHPPVTFAEMYSGMGNIGVQVSGKYPQFEEMYADPSILGELLVRFFTDVDNKIIKTEDCDLELK